VVGMALVAVLMVVGCGSSPSSSSNKVTATPAFSPAGGSYNASQTVTIADATAGAVLYCTTDGTTPTSSSPQCSQPTTVFKSEFLQAIAVAPGMTASMVAAAGYTIDLSAAATPTFSPAGGAYSSAQTLTISDATAGANIYFTTDGTVPSSSSTLYTAPITISKSETVSAIAVASGFSNSGVASAAYTISQGAAAPKFSPAGGTYATAQTVSLTDATAGAVIYYTTDGSMPSASSTLYASPIAVSQTETINAIAIASGSSSPVATAAYTISSTSGGTATPMISPASGALTPGQTVTITDATAGAVIYYTTNGNTPSASSTQYTGPLSVSQAETISAIAIASGSSSPVATAAYTVGPSGTATPVIAPAGGTFSSPQTVTITDTTNGAVIYYTTDGTTPTSSSMSYGGSVTVSASETLNAIAVAGGSSSPVATASFTVLVGNASLSGAVFSGTTAVAGAQVQLYAAGQTGYGLAATPLGASVTTAIDGSGSFALNYNCAAAPGDLVYLVATGGNTGAGPNSNLAMMAALGSCNNLSAATPIVVNEATTVASVYALSPFMTAAANVGSSSTNYLGLANAFKTVSNMVNLSTGQAYSVTPAYAASQVPYLNSSTVPQPRIDTLANLLNACVNSNGMSCGNFFSNATPVSGIQPTDTLQAMLDIAQNPGNNVSPLFGLASPAGPFQPVLTTAPTDFTLALTFTGGGLGIAPGTAITDSTGGTGGLLANTAMAIDATGNIWVTAYNAASSGGGSSSSMIAEFNNLGVPLTPATTMSAATPAVTTYGGFISGASGAASPAAIALDPTGNLWVAGVNPAIAEISPSLSVTQAALNYGSQEIFPALAIDGSANIWIAAGTTLTEIPAGSNGTQNIVSTGIGASTPSDYFSYDALSELIFDANGALWAGDSGGFGDLDLINPADASIAFDAFDTSTAPEGVYSPLAADASGNIYGCGSGILTIINAGSQSIVSTVPLASARGCGNELVMDGQGHIFAVSGNASPGVIDEFTTVGVAISPVATGYTGTSSGEMPTINPDPAANSFETGTGGLAGAAIDGSGNLWVLNADTGASTITAGNVLVQYVGIAAPVVTPTSLALQNFQVGVRP
jgi:hypothetical protein